MRKTPLARLVATVAAELMLTYPQKHEVTVQRSALGGPVNIGSFKHLPPKLTLQFTSPRTRTSGPTSALASASLS